MVKDIKKSNYFLKFMVVVLLIIISGLLGWMIGAGAFNELVKQTEPKEINIEQLKENEQTSSESNDDTINNSGFIFDPTSSDYAENNGYGSVQVTGYAYVEKVGYYEKKFDYVYFQVINSSDNVFLKFLESQDGNSFAKKDAMGLGCIDGENIKWSNYSNEHGYAYYTMDKENTSKIINSSSSNTIRLNIEKLKVKDGVGADDCYSHATKISIVE